MSVKTIRALKAGDSVEGAVIESIHLCDGADGRPPQWIAGPGFRSMIAIELRFTDGRTAIAHPDQVALATSRAASQTSHDLPADQIHLQPAV